MPVSRAARPVAEGQSADCDHDQSSEVAESRGPDRPLEADPVDPESSIELSEPARSRQSRGAAVSAASDLPARGASVACWLRVRARVCASGLAGARQAPLGKPPDPFTTREGVDRCTRFVPSGPSNRPRAVAKTAKALQKSQSRRADSNRGPLHYEGRTSRERASNREHPRARSRWKPAGASVHAVDALTRPCPG